MRVGPAGNLILAAAAPHWQTVLSGRVRLVEQAFESGAISVERPGSAAIVVRLRGRLDPSAAEWLIDQLTTAIAQGSNRLFIDTSGLDSFGAGFQGRMRSWMLENRRSLDGAHVLTDSTMVRMAAAVANIPLRGWITVHDRAEEFTAAVSAADLELRKNN